MSQVETQLVSIPMTYCQQDETCLEQLQKRFEMQEIKERVFSISPTKLFIIIFCKVGVIKIANS